MSLSYYRTGGVTSPVQTRHRPTLCPLQVLILCYNSVLKYSDYMSNILMLTFLIAHKVRPADIKVVAALGDSLTVSSRA